MICDAFVAEIGSTTTVLSAFSGLDGPHPKFLGQGSAPTSIVQGDVTIGLHEALAQLKDKLNVTELEARETFACSSAAGGLKMSVHGLVYDMTVKAAKEAALGAGANLKLITSGVLTPIDLEKIKNLGLNIIMLAGGVDYGETKTALTNAAAIAKLQLNIPIIYAGNIQIQDEIKAIFKDADQARQLYVIDNVYPRIDVLNTEEARTIIQRVFESHITKAPGMDQVRTMIKDTIIPTPGAVMEASIRLQASLGDLVTLDVGGATTDVHSVAAPSPEVEKILVAPEPFAKRTVEGDLGVYLNKDNLVQAIGIDRIAHDLDVSQDTVMMWLDDYPPIPDPIHAPLVTRLLQHAVDTGLDRHAGRYISLYGSSGKTKVAEGKDLTNVRYIILTGGALTRLSGGADIIRTTLKNHGAFRLYPLPETPVLIDHDYIMAACGVLAKKHPEAAMNLMKQSLRIG
jgi:uncharacterized protein (TIGR01319 family)